MCGHSEAMGGGTLDCVGGTQSVVAANNYSPQQPQPRINRSLSLSRFYRNAPELALSEMLVFDHDLRRSFNFCEEGIVWIGDNTFTQTQRFFWASRW